MNHCYDCNSGYEQPGTCNCFAVGGKRAAQSITLPYTNIPAPQPNTTITVTPPKPGDIRWESEGGMTGGTLPSGARITYTPCADLSIQALRGFGVTGPACGHAVLNSCGHCSDTAFEVSA